VRRPISTLRLVRTERFWLMLALSGRVPAPIRRVAIEPVRTLARRIASRPGDHPVALPAYVVARHAAGDTEAAMAVALRQGRGASDRTVRRLARIALALDEPAVADALLADREAAADDIAGIGLRAEVAVAMGRYAEATERVTRIATLDPGSYRYARLARRAAGELEMLDPAWRPVTRTHGRRNGSNGGPRAGRALHLLTNSLPYRQAGYTVRSQSVARAQQAVGLDPHMVTRAGFPGNEGVLASRGRDDVDGVPYHRVAPDGVPGQPIDQVAQATARGVRELIDVLRPAVLQPTSNYVNAHVALGLGEILSLPVVYEVRGFLEETWAARVGERALDADRYLGTRAVETAAMRRADAIVTLSETMRTEILARGGIDPERVTVVPNAVDVERFTPGPRDAALASSLGIGPSETVIGYISSLVRYEGIDVLLEAVRQLRRRTRRVRLLLVGDGEDRARLEMVAARLGLLDDGTVLFAGRIPYSEVLRWYRTIDVFVVPRTNDRVSRLVTPLKPYEAMAMERAPLVSRIPALVEMIVEGETGRSFEPEDPCALADALEALIDDPAERRRLGSAARDWVVANRTWAENGHRYLELYRRLGVA
jgi:glycosyltransferase involved in cell wall biosynthesis